MATLRPKKKERTIPIYAEKVLDAPDLIDDYYLNLLDWSANNILAISLSQTVYMLNTDSGDISQLVSMDGNEYITSVQWMPNQPNTIAVGTSDSKILLYDA